MREGARDVSGFRLPTFRPRQRAKAPPCSCGCPNGTDVRGWIGVIAQRRKTGISRDEAYALAWSRIAAVNPLPATTGRVCPHPCQKGCSRGQEEGPVAIRALERFLGDKALELGVPLPLSPPARVKHSVGVVGAGPAGLSCAYQLARRGHEVTVYDSAPRAGGMLRYGIPDYRLPPEVLDAEIERVFALGVAFEPNMRLGSDLSLETIRRRHSALFLAIGAQLGRRLKLPGEDGPGVTTGEAYLRRVSEGRRSETGARVVVVGGGNTAVDAARTARRRGAEVVLLYRRAREQMPAFEEEVDAMEAEGVRIEYLAAPVAVERTGERMSGVLVRRVRLGAPDGTGRRRPIPIPGSEFRISADSLIVAVSQRPDWRGLESVQPDGDWVEAAEDGSLAPGIWAGGDVRGPGFASLAISHGRRAAESIHGRLGGAAATPPPGITLPPLADGAVKTDFYRPRDPTESPALSPGDAIADPRAEVVGTISEEAFLREVERCYSCGLCFGCRQCWMFCTTGSVIPGAELRTGEFFTLELKSCEACGQCVDVCPTGYLEFDGSWPARSTVTS